MQIQEKKLNSRVELLELWRHSLTQDKFSNPTDAVIAELSEYFKMPSDEVRHRCINWEQESLKEWSTKDRSTSEGLLDFYHTQISWIFDTMWYHANQYHGTAPAESVEIALGLNRLGVSAGQLLDFGAGPGSSALFFNKLGWNVTLADVSTSMLDFARWRLRKHEVTATFLDTNHEKLPTAAFDLITAFDVIVHIPDAPATIAQLHNALKPGGYLIFNIDNLPLTPTTQWHLYKEQYPILGKVRTLGFRRHPKIIYFHVYQKIERSPLQTKLIQNFDRVRYNQYVTMIGNPSRRIVHYLRTQVDKLKSRQK